MKSFSHDDITQRARQLWQDYGQPAGRDDEIWLEAERQLQAGQSPAPSTTKSDDANATSESAGARGLAERVKAETAAESAVEYKISPPVSQTAAIKAAMPKPSQSSGKKKR